MNLTAYTDGSSDARTKKAGIGVVLLDDACEGDTLVELSLMLTDCTNNVAEVTAMGHAMTEAITRNAKQIVIVTDSANAIGWVKGEFQTTFPDIKKAVRMVQEQIARFKESGGKVGLKKCDGHSGETWNERAHTLANEALKSHPKEVEWL